jgi:hypothetical protein
MLELLPQNYQDLHAQVLVKTVWVVARPVLERFQGL